MKKIFIFICSFLIFVPKVYAIDDYISNAKSGILIESSTGEILYEKNKDDRVSVASLTKMMVQILVLEKIEDKTIKWSDVVTASSNASGMGGTQIWLSTGEKMSVEDLFKGLSIVSANDATVALAEYIAGSEESFVKLMNEKAKMLGLKNTHFVNSTGLDEEGNYSSAYDLSIIARELLNHDEILRFSSAYEDYIRTDTPNKYWLVNTNKLVKLYEGADGLKTGFTDDAGYTMAVTAKRNNMRLIAIVLGEDDSKVRNKETQELLDYGFDNYKIDLIKKKGEIVDTIKLEKANLKEVDISLKNDLSMLSKKTDKSINYDFNIELGEIKYPLKKGDVVGKMNLLYNEEIVKSSDIVVNDDISKINFFKYILNDIKSLF